MLRVFLFIGVLIGVAPIASAQQPCTTDARQVVNEIYRHMLERSADPASAGYVDSLTKGDASVRDVVREIAKSPEHLQRFGKDAQAVDTLYRHILGRQPDAAGQRTYAAVMASRGLAVVVDQIVNSSEYQQSYGDSGVPGSGGVTYCARGAASTQNRTPADRNQGDRNMPDQSQRGSNPAGRNQAGQNQPGTYPADRNQPPDRGQVDRYPSERDQADRSPAYRNPPDRFDYLDRSGDRFIDRYEWDGGREAFDRLDRNRDGRLTRNEFDAGYTTQASSFYGIDVNHDRRITLNEWPWSHRSFDAEDVSNDGVITQREFRGN